MDYTKKPFYLSVEDLEWVEKTFSKMTLDDKLNQVFVDMLWTEPANKVFSQQKKLQLGGYRYNNMSAKKLWKQNAAIQEAGDIPALIAANVEAGGNGAVSGGTKIGEAIACAATSDPESAYDMAYCGCREAAAVGCNWTFAPVVDIDMNWRNCVIPMRSFGNDPDMVAKMGLAYMRGAHDAGIACCMKHFPGDGCDERDQHLVTSCNSLDCKTWDETFGKVYSTLIEAGIPSIMVGHITLPSYSRFFCPDIKDEDILPASISPELLQNLLRKKLGFNGLIISDSTQMAGITSRLCRCDYLPRMLMSGCDMILYYRNHDEDIGYLKSALEDGRLTVERLDEAVHTVLAFKASLKLHEKQRSGTLMPAKSDLSVIGCMEHKSKASQIVDRSITLVKDSAHTLPLTVEKHRRIIIYTMQSGGLMSRIKDIAFGGKDGNGGKMLKKELEAQGFEVVLYRTNYLKYVSLHGVNGKKALSKLSISKYKSKYDAAIILCKIGSFATTNERSLHWKIPMGPDSPWYCKEIPTIGISVFYPFHLIDLAMVPTYVNTYDASRDAIRQTVAKLMGKSEFKGVSPVDAFCNRWDTKN